MPTMAYVTARKNGTWELRESVSTPEGPRSRTLASFRTLSDEVIQHAQARAVKPFDRGEVRDAAHRAGAPVDLATADRAAGDLLRELANGYEPHPILRALLIDALQEGPPARLGAARKTWQEARAEAGVPQIEELDNARASAAWLTRTPAERGAALDDLLHLADQFPSNRRIGERLSFPRLGNAA
jgi:hypothetical protein